MKNMKKLVFFSVLSISVSSCSLFGSKKTEEEIQTEKAKKESVNPLPADAMPTPYFSMPNVKGEAKVKSTNERIAEVTLKLNGFYKLLAEKKYQEADDEIAKIMAENEDLPFLAYLRGAALVLNKKFDSAVAYIDKAETSTPSYTLPEVLMSLLETVQFYEKNEILKVEIEKAKKEEESKKQELISVQQSLKQITDEIQRTKRETLELQKNPEGAAIVPESLPEAQIPAVVPQVQPSVDAPVQQQAPVDENTIKMPINEVSPAPVAPVEEQAQPGVYTDENGNEIKVK